MSDQKQRRVSDIASLLPEHPKGVGKPISDRAAWDAFGAMKRHQSAPQEAEKLLTSPLPDASDELYLDYSRTGKRTAWQGARDRHLRLKPLVLAECIEDKGRFLPAIETLIAALCAERTWVLPAHDPSLLNFRREKVSIDLASAAYAWDMATADYLVGDKLSAEMRQEIRENIRWRIIDPFRQIDPSAPDRNWWVVAKNNWNAVCLAGVTGSILEQVESRDERAAFLADIIEYSEYYLKSYEDDGYCTEGLNYWSYGFGNYALLAQTILQATGGKIDLMAPPLVEEIARYPVKIHVMNGVYPALADCPANVKPNHNLMYFVNRRWNLGLTPYDEPDANGTLPDTMIYSDQVAPPRPATPSEPPLRDWFHKGGVLVSRPAAGSPCRMGVVLKGGHNFEIHNHNDVGSYVVVVGSQSVLLDPGTESYTSRTFGPRRYESNVLNSFGHPVPVVAGQLQREALEARADIRRAEFSEQADILELEIRSAYLVEDLTSLVRTFLYNREGQGSLTVTDRAEFASPQLFGTALITGGTCERVDDRTLTVQSGGETLLVTIDAGGEPFEIMIDEIKEETPVQPVRIGINLTNPIRSAKVTVEIETT